MRLLTVLSLLLCLAPGLTRAAESDAVRSSRATVTLAAAVDAVAPGEPFQLALRLRLAPGWHTYWRNPGDAGAPPELSLDQPAGAVAGRIEWPAPERLPSGGLVSFGYTGDVLLPFQVTPPAGLMPGETVTVAAEATWLVCAEICVPEEGRFALTLPVAPVAVPDPRRTVAFGAATAAVPRAPPGATGAIRRGNRLTLTVAVSGEWRDAIFFPDAGGIIDNAAPQAMRARDGTVSLELAAAAAAVADLTGALVLTAADGSRAAFAIATPVVAASGGGAAGLPLALALGLLGGLLLNLMPCVFPVLAMKAMAVARLSGTARRTVRAQAVSYTAGVLATSLALGGGLLLLRAAGSAAGWGFQLTEPVFVAGLAWLLLAVGLNLSGVYGFGGPVGAGGALAGRGGHAGSFATGVLAVLVATPCSAPFMATALGAALAMPPAAALTVFAALGLGLAAPSILLALAPGLADALPRPGAWMMRLQQGLAFPMYGAAAWLIWVLAQQAGPAGLALALGGAMLVAFAAWVLGTTQAASGRGRIGRAVAVASVAGALLLLPGLAAAPPPEEPATAATSWSAERVAALQAAGRPVFVNFTAAWCLTCIVNERAVLGTAATREAFAKADAARLVGDWTRGDPAIGALLRSLGRDGVPLYLVYPAGAGAPAILPQLLSEPVLRQALLAAGPRGPVAAGVR